MANFWENDPIVSAPAGPANSAMPAPPVNPGATSDWWANDPLVEEAPEREASARDRYDAALEKVRVLQAPDMDAAEFRKMFTEGQDTLIPGVKNPGRFAPYDATELSQHGMFFGLTDEMDAGMGALGAGLGKLFTGQGPEMGDVWAARHELEQARRDYGREMMGNWGTVAEIAGGLGAGGIATKGAQAIGSQAPGVWKTVKGLTGAGASGGAYGFGSTDGDLGDRAGGAVVGAGTGAMVGAAAPVIAKGIQQIARAPASVATKSATNAAVASAPTAAAIKAASKAGYRAAEKTGAVVDGSAPNLLNHDIGQKLVDAGMMLPNGRLVGGFPKVNGALNALRQYTATGSLTVKQAQVLRKTFANVAGSNEGTEAAIGRAMVDQLDDFFESLPVAAFSTNGKAGMDAVKHWAQARKDWSRFKRTDAIEKAIRNAQYSQTGFAEGLRGQFATILKSEKKSRGFSDIELAAMDRYAKGGTISDFLKSVSSGGAIPAGILGSLAAGPVAGGAMALGRAGAGKLARGSLDRGARSAAEAVRAQVASPGGLPLPSPVTRPPVVIDGVARRIGTSVANPGLADQRTSLLELLQGPNALGGVR